VYFLDKYLSKKEIFYLFFLLWPVVFFFSSGILNFYVISLIIFYFFFLNKNKIVLFKKYKILFLFFFFLIFLSFINNYKEIDNIESFYSITLLRFFFVYLFFRVFFTQIKSNFIYSFFKIFFFTSVLLSFDIFFQHILGYDLLGFKSYDGRYNGFFEHEAVGGSYIYKFLIFSIPAIFLLKFLNKYNLKIVTLVICISGILFSLDRSPFVYSITLLLLFFFFLKGKRIFFFLTIALVFFIFIVSFKNYSLLQIRYSYEFKAFEKVIASEIIKLQQLKNADINAVNSDQEKKLILNGYVNIYYSSYVLIKNKLFLGYGHKKYLLNCLKLDESKFKNITKVCSNHPHNIFIEIFLAGGLVSILLFLVFIFKVLRKLQKNLTYNKVNIIFFIFLLIEFFPLKNSGSIFSTFNGYIFFSTLGIILGLTTKKV